MLKTAALYGFVTLALTSVHHAYGAWVYETPWRYHVIPVSAVAGAAMLAGLQWHRAGRSSTTRTIGIWTFGLTTLLLPVLGIGAFEGLYNHVLKNLLYFGGASPDLLARMFPAPRYEMPNDAVFEITGVLQALPAGVTLKHLMAMTRDRIWRDAAHEAPS